MSDYLAELQSILDERVKTRQAVQDSPEYKEYEESVMRTVELLRQKTKQPDAVDLLMDERLMLSLPLDKGEASPEEIEFSNKAIVELDAAVNCLDWYRV